MENDGLTLTYFAHQEEQVIMCYCHNCAAFNCSDEIAGCIEKAYEQIQFSEATRVLFFSSPKKMTEYAKKV